MLMRKRLSKWSAILIALMMAFLMPAAAFAESGSTSSIKVLMTVSYKGVLASDKEGNPMVEREVTVTDADGDSKLTIDDALVAAHKAYYKDGEAGYDIEFFQTQNYSYYSVTKLWGEETQNNLFFKNNNGIAGAKDETIQDGDNIYASVNQDPAYNDYKTVFNVTKKSAAGGEAITVTLNGRYGMGNEADAPIAGAQIGYWDHGQFKAISGVVTDANGKAVFSMDKKGEYILTANGIIKGVDPWTGNAVDAPIMAPYCFLTITSDAPVSISGATVTVASATYTGKALKPDVTVKLGGKTLVKDKDYTLAYSNNKNAGKKAKVTATGIGGYTGTVSKVFTINKAKQPAKVTFKNKSFSGKILKRKKASYNAVTIKNKKGSVKYTLKWNKKAKKVLKFSKGKITVKKGAKKGIYKIKVTVKIKGTANYLAKTYKKTIKVQVK